MNRNASLLLLGAVLLSTILVVGRGGAQALRGKRPPDFGGIALDGRKITLSEYRGKNPVVLSFFASFDRQCLKEFPHLKELDARLGPKGLRVVAVSLDQDRAAAESVPNHEKVRFPVLFDPKGTIASDYQVQALPHTVVIDRDGTVRGVFVGLGLEGLDKAVEQSIAAR